MMVDRLIPQLAINMIRKGPGKLFLAASIRGRLVRPDTESGTPRLWPMNWSERKCDDPAVDAGYPALMAG